MKNHDRNESEMRRRRRRRSHANWRFGAFSARRKPFHPEVELRREACRARTINQFHGVVRRGGKVFETKAEKPYHSVREAVREERKLLDIKILLKIYVACTKHTTNAKSLASPYACDIFVDFVGKVSLRLPSLRGNGRSALKMP